MKLLRSIFDTSLIFLGGFKIMKLSLDKVTSRINISDYSLQEIAIYFEKFDNNIIVIKTDKRVIKLTISKNSLPHLLGLQHIFNKNKERKYYKGINGFNLLKNGKSTINNINNILKQKNSLIYSKFIFQRIEYLPMFFNLLKNNTFLKIMDKKSLNAQVN